MSGEEYIYKYTRQQAIADGVLVDLSKNELSDMVREVGIKTPVAMTIGAWVQAIGLLDDPLPVGQSLNGRLWDVLTVLVYSIRMTKQNAPTVNFRVSVWNGKKHENVYLWAKIHPGDYGEPVITIMLQGED